MILGPICSFTKGQEQFAKYGARTREGDFKTQRKDPNCYALEG